MSKTTGYLSQLTVSDGDGVDGIKSSKAVGSGSSGFVLYAQKVGALGDNITITLTDPLGNNQSLSVSVSGTDIDVSLATNGSGTITSTALDVITAINQRKDSASLVEAKPNTVGSGGVVSAAAQASLAGGALSTHTFTAIANLRDFNHNSGTTGVVDATTADSPDSTAETVPGFLSAGTFDFTIVFDPDDATVDTIEAYRRSRITKRWRFTLNDASRTSFEFNGFVSDLGLAVPLQDVVTRSCQIAISGALLRTYAS